MEENKIIVKNLQISYKVFGSEGGKPFLILHGWGSKSDRWEKSGELLAEKGFCVFVPDLPGFGKSQEPLTTWSLDTYVEWLKEFCEKIPKLQGEFYLLGHSFGGTLSAKFSIKYNQNIKRVFLVSASCIRNKTTAKKIFYVIAKIVKVFSFLPYYHQFRKAVYKFIIKKSDYPYFSDRMQEVYLKAISDDLSHKLPFIKIPTIIIFGDQDRITPVYQARLMHKKILNSKLIIISNADHFLNIKIPEVLAEKISENI